MDWADRIRTQAMAALLTTFADHDMYDERHGTVQVSADRLMTERMIMDSGGEQWIYTTEIEVSVSRRRLH